LDQNIISHLRVGQDARDDLLAILRKLQENGAVFVFSETHVAECRDSAQPELFAQVIEDLPIYFMELNSASDEEVVLSLGNARERFSAPEDHCNKARRLMENLLHIMHFASGWLDETELQDLRNDMISEMNDFWDTIQSALDEDVLGEGLAEGVKHALATSQNEMVSIIDGLPFERARAEWEIEAAQLRQRLPENYAQLDAIADENAVAFIFSCLGEDEGAKIKNQFPPGFWSELSQRKSNELSGLALLLFMCGLVRDRRVKKGDTLQRVKHFRGQFRDGVHIENAARCCVFITADKGAARLAGSLYAYAGINTKVIQLKFFNKAA